MVNHKLSKINEGKHTAICLVCGPVTIYPKYVKSPRWRCAKRTNERTLKYRRNHTAIGKACEICKADTLLCWDHNHVSGVYRGTLCRNCNLAIGLLKDNPALCLQAARYLRP